MSRRVLPVALVLGLFAAACAGPPSAEIGFGSGTQFVPQVVDAQDDVGLFPSVAVNADGVPYVSYFGFPEKLAEGDVALPRPIGAPSVPSVLLASASDGVWTRGAVAMEKPIPNVDVAFGPAEVPHVKSLRPENVNGTSIAVDSGGGLHVAWVGDSGVWYAHNMDGTRFTASQVEKADNAQRGPIGQPSVAVDPQGTPWVAYTRTTAQGQEVVVATPSGSGWGEEIVATMPLNRGGEQPSRTAIAVLGDGSPIVAFASPETIDVAVGAPDGGWTRSTVELGAAPTAVSLAPGANGDVVASYYIGDEIHAATSKDGASWRSATVASVGTGENPDGRATGIGVDGQGTTYVTWYDPATDDVRLASSSGSEFSPLDTTGTTAGELPSLAVTDDGHVYVAWYDETDQNLMLGAYGEVGGIEFAIQSPTPTGPVSQPSPSGGPTQQCTTAENGELTVTAEGVAFDTGCIQIPAGQKVTIHFDNKDVGTQHNIAVYPSQSELTNPLFRGDLVTGPDTMDYEVGPLDAGEHYFQCDVHPTMNGTFTVVSGGGGGSGGGGDGGGSVTTSVTAQGLAFDTTQIDLAAGKQTTLTFDNQDAGTQHNIAIYSSSTDLANPLFRGDLLTGPDSVDYTIPALDAGTYYFQCDVHPTMNGSVVVT